MTLNKLQTPQKDLRALLTYNNLGQNFYGKNAIILPNISQKVWIFFFSELQDKNKWKKKKKGIRSFKFIL